MALPLKKNTACLITWLMTCRWTWDMEGTAWNPNLQQRRSIQRWIKFPPTLYFSTSPFYVSWFSSPKFPRFILPHSRDIAFPSSHLYILPSQSSLTPPPRRGIRNFIQPCVYRCNQIYWFNLRKLRIYAEWLIGINLLLLLIYKPSFRIFLYTLLHNARTHRFTTRN